MTTTASKPVGVVLPIAATEPISVVPFRARPIPLSAVCLTGGPLKHAQDITAQYLLELEPDRMMAFYRIRAGLEPKAEGYGGWDGAGRNLTGHIAGHYLSAVSLMYTATGDTRFLERAGYLVAEMAKVQDANGNGYVGALEEGQEKFAEVSRGDIRSGGFDLNGLWAPWYTLHKTYAGLRDAYRHTGNRAALAVEIKFAEWAQGVMATLDYDQDQKMLNTEFGGMGEVFADLYADTGDHRWLTLSDRFEHEVVVGPLSRHVNNLGGLHGNTQIPKLIGSLTRFITTGKHEDGEAARFFWDAVVNQHTFASGGHGKDEYFGPPDELSERVDGRTAEACNIYNMLKMTRTLFALEPDIRFAEFQERSLFNHVLASIDPDDARVCYMVPVGRGVEHEYQDKFHDFTCCVGTGMESHALHGDGIYYEAGNRLWVNIYAPSTMKWAEAGLTLTMETSFPDGDDATITLTLDAPSKFTLALRRPSWAGNGFTVTVNGEALEMLPDAGSYVEIDREWSSGDTVSLTLPKTLRTESLPDNANRVSLLWGPLVLAGDLGPEQEPGGSRIPVLVASGDSVASWLTPSAETPGSFRTDGTAWDSANPDLALDVDLKPFYKLHRRTYTTYWDVFSPEEWATKSVEVAAAAEARQHLEAATVAYAQPGEMQPERDYKQEGEESYPDRFFGKPGRQAAKWFSFELPVDPESPLALVVTYNTEERMKRTVDILIDGHKIGEHSIERSRPGCERGHFHEVAYPIAPEFVAGKEAVTVKFEATQGNHTPMVFGIRMVRR